MRPDRRHAFLLAAAWAPSLAFAHGSFAVFKPFWAGVFHALISPVAVGAVVGFVCIAVRGREERVLYQAVLAGIVAVFAVMYAAPGWAKWAPLVLAAVGLLGVVGRPLPFAATLPLALGTGLVAGTMADVDVRSWFNALGVGFLVTYLALAIVSILWVLEDRVSRRPLVLIGRRVICAWVSAIALLLGALAIRNG